MKPSVQDATHYHLQSGMWYKFGEFTVYFWDSSTGGWITSMCSRKTVNSSDFVTAQKALEQGYKYPQYPNTTQGVIVDSRGSGEVLEASETQRKTVDDLYEDHFDKVKKINEAISHYPHITHEQHKLLIDNGYKVNSVGIFKDGVLQVKPSEQTAGFGPVYAGAVELNKKWPKRIEVADNISINEPLVPDMTEANDKKVNTTSANNRQVGGDHYKKMKIQPWDLFGSIFNLDEQIGFYLGNVYKYLMRYDSKSGTEDLKKAKHYLEKLIEVKRGAASADVGGK